MGVVLTKFNKFLYLIEPNMIEDLKITFHCSTSGNEIFVFIDWKVQNFTLIRFIDFKSVL